MKCVYNTLECNNIAVIEPAGSYAIDVPIEVPSSICDNDEGIVTEALTANVQTYTESYLVETAEVTSTCGTNRKKRSATVTLAFTITGNVNPVDLYINGVYQSGTGKYSKLFYTDQLFHILMRYWKYQIYQFT